MHNRLIIKLLIPLLALLLAIPFIGVGCKEEPLPSAPAPVPAPPSGLPTPKELYRTRVPNMDLDIYVYIKQDNPTTVPADLIDMPFDVDVESFALWGVSVEDDAAFGGGLTCSNNADAESIHAQITKEGDIWTSLSGNTIYFAKNSGVAAEALKEAILNNDFKDYDDEKSLKAVAALPGGGDARLGGVVVVKSLKALAGQMAEGGGIEGMGMAGIMEMGLDVAVAGFYSSQQIEVAEIQKMLGGSIGDTEMGVLVSAKSSFPGFVVGPAVKKILTEAGFTQTSLDGVTLYQYSIKTDTGKSIPVLVKVDDNYFFAALARQESYAQTLITAASKW